MEFVEAEIEKLSVHKFSKTGKGSQKVSERLGVITHYLSDFFCYAHSEYFQSGIVSHFLYELRLLSYFRRNQKVVRLYTADHLAKVMTSSPKIMNYINETHEKYLSMIKGNPAPYEVDTVNAVWVNIFICVSIISLCGRPSTTPQRSYR